MNLNLPLRLCVLCAPCFLRSFVVKKKIICALVLGLLGSLFVFSHQSGGEVEGEGSCYVIVHGHFITEPGGIISGCRVGGSQCTFTVPVPCP